MSGGPSTSWWITASGRLLQKRPMESSAILARLGPVAVPVALGEGMRHVLGEDAHQVRAVGRDAGVVGGLEVELGPQPRRQLAGAAPVS